MSQDLLFKNWLSGSRIKTTSLQKCWILKALICGETFYPKNHLLKSSQSRQLWFMQPTLTNKMDEKP